MWRTLFILAMAAAQPAAAQPSQPPAKAVDLLQALAADVVAVRRYESFGTDLSRGYELDTRPRQNVYGDCRSQRVFFFEPAFRRHDVRETDLDQLVVINRYRRPGWKDDKSPRDCGEPTEAIWIRAKDDYTFNRSALYLNFVQEKALNRDISPPRGFKFTCTDSDRPCSESLEKLSKAFTVSDAEVSWDWEERKVVLAQTELPDVPRFILTINIGEVGFVERVDLEIPFPRYPGQASLH